MSKYMNNPVKTFSIRFEEGAPINKTKYSQYVADYYNTDHTELLVESSCYDLLPNLVWSLDDLIADAAIIPVYIMAKHAKNKMTVALTGDGADEVFAGYSEAYRAQKYNFLQFFPKSITNSLMTYYNYIPIHKIQLLLSYLNSSQNDIDRYFRFVLKIPDEEKNIMVSFRTENVKDLIRPKFIKNLDIINQFTAWDLKHQLPNQYNMKIDKMTMAASLEARIPFLDPKIVSWSASIPSNLKFNGKIDKYIFRLAMKDVLPPEILKRKKTGFGTPVSFWLSKDLRENSSIILERLNKRNSLIRPSYIKNIKRNRFNKLYENRAWNLIMFELWYETFFENEELKPIKF